MPPKTLSLYVLTLLGLTAGCDVFGPAPSLSHAGVTSGCGPAGGPTVVLILSHSPIGSGQPLTPYVDVEFTQNMTSASLAGRTWTVGGTDGMWASYVPWPATRQSATSGSITITSVDSTNAIEGDLDLQFPSRIVVTHFKAGWFKSDLQFCN